MDPADEILSQIPISQLAQQLGVDEATAEEAVRSAVPALLGGMAANAQDPGGAASLENALSQHTSNPLDGLGLEGVDTKDGEAIVGNVFGDNTDQVVNKLGGQAGDKGMMQQLLPILAPIILSMLAGKFMKGQGGGPAPAPAGSEAPAGGPMPSGGTGVGGLEDLLGSATAAAGGSGGGAGGIGDLLGGLLGGSSGGSAAGIEDLLGGLLGGGTKS
jgi:hypothetical protein